MKSTVHLLSASSSILHSLKSDVFVTHISLVLFQDDMPGELGLWYRRKLFNNVLQSLKASHPQLVTVVCGGHEGHADKVRQMQHQQISYKGREGRSNPGCVKFTIQY